MALPGFQGSRFRVQGSKFGVCHKLPKYNPPLPPPSAWTGGGLVPPWTYPGTIDPAPAPLFDQAHLSNAVSSGVSALSPYSALDVGCWMFDVRCSPPVPRTPQNGLQVYHRGLDVAVTQQLLNRLQLTEDRRLEVAVFLLPGSAASWHRWCGRLGDRQGDIGERGRRPILVRENPLRALRR